MPETIYDREKLRKKVLEHLRQQTARHSTGQVATAIGAQFWAVEGALEDLFQARQVTFVAGAGWLGQEAPKPGAKQLSDDAQTSLEASS